MARNRQLRFMFCGVSTLVMLILVVMSVADTKMNDTCGKVAFEFNNIHWTQSKTIPSFNLFVHDPAQCQYISKSILTTGVWESDATKWFGEILGNASVKQRLFLDIGANLGWFSLVAINMGHTAIAVEPMRYNIELLLASVCNNSGFRSRITVYNYAFSTSVNGEACIAPSFAGGPQNEGNGQIGSGNSSSSSSKECREIVQLRRMDDILRTLQERPYLVKLDTEGHELLALQGGRQVFSRTRPCIIVFEYIERYLVFARVVPSDLFHYFLSLNYSINNRIDIKSVTSTIKTDFNYAVNYMDDECSLHLPTRYTKLLWLSMTLRGYNP